MKVTQCSDCEFNLLLFFIFEIAAEQSRECFEQINIKKYRGKEYIFCLVFIKKKCYMLVF